MQLTRMHWFDVEDIGPAELSKALDLVGGFLDSRAERWYLIQSVTAVLDSPSVCLSDRQRAHLLVYRAGLLGNLGEIDAAADSYREAEGIADQLVQAGDGEPEDQQLSARILLGRGNNVGVQAEGLE